MSGCRAAAASPGTSCAISTRCSSPTWWGFLRAVVAEHVNSAVPVLIATDPEGRIADWVAEKVVDFVPNPCEESAEATDLAQAVDTLNRWWALCRIRRPRCPRSPRRWYRGRSERYLA